MHVKVGHHEASLDRYEVTSEGGWPRDLDVIARRGEEFLAGSKAYLAYRSRGVKPPPSLVEAWKHFYDFYAAEPCVPEELRACRTRT